MALSDDILCGSEDECLHPRRRPRHRVRTEGAIFFVGAPPRHANLVARLLNPCRLCQVAFACSSKIGRMKTVGEGYYLRTLSARVENFVCDRQRRQKKAPSHTLLKKDRESLDEPLRATEKPPRSEKKKSEPLSAFRHWPEPRQLRKFPHVAVRVVFAICTSHAPRPPRS